MPIFSVEKVWEAFALGQMEKIIVIGYIKHHYPKEYRYWDTFRYPNTYTLSGND